MKLFEWYVIDQTLKDTNYVNLNGVALFLYGPDEEFVICFGHHYNNDMGK